MAASPISSVGTLVLQGRTHRYCSLLQAEAAGLAGVSRLPRCLRVILENVLRQAALGLDDAQQAHTVLRWLDRKRGDGDIRFRPLRVMMDDTAGLPLVGDLAAMRDEAAEAGVDPRTIDLALPVDFVVDHSVIADHAGTADALERNVALELARNRERYEFLRWGAGAFPRLRVYPPGSGICHQINLEHLSEVVALREFAGEPWLCPDSMVGIDSHTPMVNALGIVGWGVAGMEGLAAALGDPVSLRLPEVLGVRLTGRLRPGVLATDLVLTLVQKLRAAGVVGRFVEYFGPGLDGLSCPDRATVANMTPECGATMSYFPIDAQTVQYLRVTGRSGEHCERVAAYARAQGLWREPEEAAADYSETLTIALDTIEPSVSGPRWPHARIAPHEVPAAFGASVTRPAVTAGADGTAIRDGDIAIAAITSCTNTSNPAAMLAAGLVARNALARGLRVAPHVKTSFSPGSRVVADYLAAVGLLASLEGLGFHIAGFGCMTCVGFSGPLHEEAARAATQQQVALAAVISGNRNYDGRVHADVHASFLASPPLVVAYALAGTVLLDPANDPLGRDAAGNPIRLAELWPDPAELQSLIVQAGDPALYLARYANVRDGTPGWRALDAPTGVRYDWNPASSILCRPPMVDAPVDGPRPLVGARVLAVFGDLVTTEHVSPMGPIPRESPAARYLQSLGVTPQALGTYAGRRLNHEVMMRGTFAFGALRNSLTPDHPGGYAPHAPSGEIVPVYEAAQRYRASATPLVVFAGCDYGTGSSRDWSAKGPRMLGVQAIVAASFERIHRANLVAAGVLPLELPAGVTPQALALQGDETVDIEDLPSLDRPLAHVTCRIRRPDGRTTLLDLTARLDTEREVQTWRNGGLIRDLLRRLVGTRRADVQDP
jgi:aconitate hydratase